MYIKGERPERVWFSSDKEFDAAMKQYELDLIEQRHQADVRRQDDQRLSDLKEKNKHFELERRSNEQRIEFEVRNKYFLALATLAAASITLLVQHIFLSLSEYSDVAKLALKFTLMFFAISLILSVVHNFINTRDVFKQDKKEEIESIILGLAAVIFYIAGVGVLVITVISSF